MLPRDRGLRLLSRLRAACQVVLIAASLACIAANVHVLSHTVGRAPYMAVDDTLGNVAFSLADLHRFGDMSMPIQSGVLVGVPGIPLMQRHRSFVTYGPWYFYAGAAVSWLFGDAIEILRGLHLAGLLFVCGLAFLWMWRDSLAAPAALLACVLTVFGTSQWPMVRPDIMVSVFAFAAIVCAGCGMSSGTWPWWAGAGFFAAAAFVSHQIAFGIVPAMALTWLVWAWLDERPLCARRRLSWRHWRALLAGVAGVAASLFLYLATIQFRVRDLVTLWSGYFNWMNSRAGTVVAGPVNPGFTTVFFKHVAAAWGGTSPWLQWLAALGALAAAAAFVARRWMSPDERRRASSLLVPPIAAGLVFQVSLGIYNNFHMGYEIFPQIYPFWIAAAAWAAVSGILLRRRPAAGLVAESVLALAVAAVLVSQSRARLDNGTVFTEAANRSVPISDYISQVLAPIPRGASAWGEVMLGLQSGTRIQMVAFGQAEELIPRTLRANRQALAPDFLLLGLGEQQVEIRNAARGSSDSGLSWVAHWFPAARYRLISLVHAPPYGTTSVYQKLEAAAPEMPPSVALWQAGSGHWTSRLGNPLTVSPRDIAPLTLRVASVGEAAAARSMSLDLPQGAYYVSLGIRHGGTREGGLIVATGPDFQNRLPMPGDLSTPASSAPYVSYVDRTAMLIAHPGGTLVLSQFDDPRASFVVEEVRPLLVIAPSRPGVAVDLPSLADWKVVPGVRPIVHTADEVKVEGSLTQSAYQVMSPPIAVPPSTSMELVLPLSAENGQVAVGILDDTSKWLYQAPPGQTVVRFDSGQTRHVVVVVYNSFEKAPAQPPIIELRPATLRALQRERQYVDRLMDAAE